MAITSEIGNVGNIFADALNAAKTVTSQVSDVYSQTQNQFGSRRDINQQCGWAPQPQAPNPYDYANYGYGYGNPTSQFGYYGTTNVSQDAGYPGIASLSYGKGGY